MARGTRLAVKTNSALVTGIVRSTGKDTNVKADSHKNIIFVVIIPMVRACTA